MKLRYEKITKENVKLAARLQYEIFPYSAAYSKYLKELDNQGLPVNYLVYFSDKIIGVVGLYEIEEYKDDIWLSWFGLLKDYRFKGFGSKIFSDIKIMAKKYNKKYLRLFTFEVWNSEAQIFYKKHSDLEEYYKNKDDNQYDIKEGVCKIFSFKLENEIPPLWNDKFIDIGNDDKEHEESIKLMKRDFIIN